MGELQAVNPLDSKQDLDELWGGGHEGQVPQVGGDAVKVEEARN